MMALAFTSALLTAAAGVAAQPPVGDKPANKYFGRSAHQLAVCAARRRPTADKMLATLPGTAEESRAALLLLDPTPDCERGSNNPRFDVRYVRGGVAEALYKEDFDFSGTATRNIAGIYPVPRPEQVAGLSEATKSTIGMIMVAQCVALADIDAIADLLVTHVGFPAEMAAMKRLQPLLESCAPKGVLANIPPLLMRGYLAEGAYRVSVMEARGQRQ